MRAPASTYRLQLTPDFPFAQAAAIAPYLAALGVDWVYTSPYLQARRGSTHGYDVVDHGAINIELGGSEGHQAFISALRAQNLGHLFDFPPNHMGVEGKENAWWLDVLENGEDSFAAPYFDMDWSPLKPELAGKVLLPFLRASLGDALDQQEIRMVFASGKFFACVYGSHRFPLDPGTYPLILEKALALLREKQGRLSFAGFALEGLLRGFASLPRQVPEEQKAERGAEKDRLIDGLSALSRQSPEALQAIEETLALFLGDAKGKARLLSLLRAQRWRLAHWKTAADDINYRRFFDVNDLVAIRQEKQEVFSATHTFLLALVGEGKIDGIRVDHIDGLALPRKYLLDLQGALAKVQGAEEDKTPFYVVVEKILAPEERIPRDWPVSGATGYEFLAQAGGLWFDPSGKMPLLRAWLFFSQEEKSFSEVGKEGKKTVLDTILASELNTLAQKFSRLAEADPHTCDFTWGRLKEAISAILTHFPRYRTYGEGRGMSEEDRRAVQFAVENAKKSAVAAEPSVFDFVCDVLLGNLPETISQARAADALIRFQETSGPATAKGMEDTAFYRCFPLASLCEVGSEPNAFGVSLAQFHAAMQGRQELMPLGLSATSTHDTKRSEDARARLFLLSECPRLWARKTMGWQRQNASHKTQVEDALAPSAKDEYFFYQHLLAVWPLEKVEKEGLEELRGRMKRFMEKALREAKEKSSWIRPNALYEEAALSFVDKALEREDSPFVLDFSAFANFLAPFGLWTSLSQALVKLCAPGVPDIYQGCELWDFSLVDPDNRRPVDYGKRARMLEALDASFALDPQKNAREAMADLFSAKAKLWLTARLLRLRRQEREFFAKAAYRPLRVFGPHADHLAAFARVWQDKALVAVVPRWFYKLLGKEGSALGELWKEDALDVSGIGEAFTHLLSQEKILAKEGLLPLNEVFATFCPAALWLGDSVSV